MTSVRCYSPNNPAASPTNEILSQGDNWFIFHLLSASDLHNIQATNAHFSQDILSALLNKPIPGQGVFWSSSSGKPYPVALRVLSFERMVRPQDPQYTRAVVDTYAQALKQRFMLSNAPVGLFSENGATEPSANGSEPVPVDPFDHYRGLAIGAVEHNAQFQTFMQGNGAAWGFMKSVIRDAISNDVDGVDDLAYDLVRPVLDEVWGEKDVHWETARGTTAYVRWREAIQ